MDLQVTSQHLQCAHLPFEGVNYSKGVDCSEGVYTYIPSSLKEDAGMVSMIIYDSIAHYQDTCAITQC